MESTVNQQNASVNDDNVLELFQTAALILGSQDEAVATVEQAVARSQADPCTDPGKAQQESRELLVRMALERAVELDPAGFRQNDLAGPDLCIDTEDLESTGVTTEQLTELIATGAGRPHLREWLEHLRPASRVVFVLRAMMGKDSASVAEDLRRANANGGSGWTAEQVGLVFRGALCSLASSLVHTPGSFAARA
jgi:hypothetical protein